jgi:PAS domain S-box-containing protein
MPDLNQGNAPPESNSSYRSITIFPALGISFGRWSHVAFCTLLALVITAVFILDFMTPLGVAVTFLYVLAILITTWIPGFRAPLVTAGICSTLTLIGILFSPSSSVVEASTVSFANRSASIAVVWITALALLGRKRSHESLESILQGSPVGEILVDSEGVIRMVNQQAEAMFDYRAEELVGRSVEQLLPERFRTGHAEFRRRFLSAPIPRPMGQGRELFAKRKDGAEFPVEIALSPVSTFAGKTVLASIVDISERKASHRLLLDRARQQAAVADLGQFALEVSDLDQVMNQVVVRISETLEVEFCKILELDGRQLKLRAGVGWREGLVGSAIVGTERTSQAGFTLMCHAPVVVADLRSEPRFSGPALLTDHGVVSGMSCIIAGTPDSPYGVLGVHTAQKRSFSDDDVHFLESIANVVAQSVQRFYAETELRRSVEQLRRSRDTFLKLIQNNPFGVYLVDSNFRLAQVSAGSQKVFGSVHPLIGRDFAEVLRIIWPEPFASHAIERFCHTLATGEPYHSRDITVHRSDTDAVESYDWRIERVTLPDGQPGVVCYFYDMTERVRHEQEIHRLKEELEAKVLERTHELMEKQDQLRTMATELTLTEQRERRRLATELHDYLAQLLVVCRMKLSQAERQFKPGSDTIWFKEIDRILEQSLVYTRSLVAELSPQVLYQFGLPKALKWLGEQMLQHGLVVKVESESDSLPLPEERAVLLFESVRELLFNIIKHAGTDHASVSVTKQSNGEICIRVSDAGQGFDLAASTISADYQSPSMRFGHLSIQERMTALKGRLNIDSSPGQGTTVTLVLPRELPESRKPAQDQVDFRSEALPRAQRAEHPRARTQSKVRILLVDDHAMVREGLRISLEIDPSLEVIGEASNGMEALAVVRQLHPDVVIMDVNMDGMNGIDATQRLRTESPATRVIGLSVNADEFTRDAMLDAGASLFLSKHAPAHQLCDAILSLMPNQAAPT